MALPPLSIDAARRVLARAGYGARPGEAEALTRQGLAPWVEQQLARRGDDPTTVARLAALRIPARIPGADGKLAQEMVPLGRLVDSPEERAARAGTPVNGVVPPEPERIKLELRAATLLRKVSSEAQLYERMVEFWHDHFAVNIDAHPRIATSAAEYDRRIRAQALGNFRPLLEAIAAAPAMLFFLSNAGSRAGAPNENYARELLELHTLGQPAYFGGARSNSGLPRGPDGYPLGYVDADVWEVARAFTGWTVAIGQGSEQGRLPRTGDFMFHEVWHDHYQKRVLGRDLEPFAPGMAHGRAVLDIVATHPATARFVCGKLVRFLVGEQAPAVVAERAAAVFLAQAGQPDQLAQVVRAVLAGPEIADPALGRPRRPLDLVAAAARALAIPLTPNPWLLTGLANAGQVLFGWPSPDGQPLDATQYDGTGALRARWALLLDLARNAQGTGAPALLAELAGQPVAIVVTRLAGAVLGADAAPVARTVLGVWSRAGRNPTPNAAEVGELAGWLLAAPAFQQC